MASYYHLPGIRIRCTVSVLRLLLGAVLGLGFAPWVWGVTLSPAPSSALVLTATDQGGVSLTPYLASLEDPGRAMTLAQAQAADVAGQLQGHAPAGAISFGYTRSAYWLRLNLRNDSPQPASRFLEIAYPGIGDLQLFELNPTGLLRHTATGSVKPFASRGYDSRFFVFPITVAPQSELTLWVRAQSPGPISIPAQLWTPTAFHLHERADYAAQSWYFGMAAAMIAFNLLLFIALRDGSYLLYVLFASCLAIALGVQEGLAKQLLLLESPAWGFLPANSTYSLSLAALLVFMRKMMNTAALFGWFDRVLVVVAFLFALSPLLFIVALESIMMPVALAYGACAVLILGSGIAGAIMRQRTAYFFLAAFAVLSLGAITTVLRFLDGVPTNVLTINALQLGSAVEMIVLALALADRFNTIRREKQQAQSEALAAQARAVEVLQSSERMLEAQVVQRTQALNQKNKELEQALVTIGDVERIARHDLRTPLASLAAAPGLLRDLRQASPREERIFGLIENAANQALGMVNLSLDLFRMENGSYDFHPAPVNLTALAGMVVQHLSVHAASKSVRIEVVASDAPVWAHAEQSLCYSIIANLGKNAIEAAPENSTVVFSLTGSERERRSSLSIHNLGEVPPAIQARFFEKYATAGKAGGTGLGTYSSHLLARVQGGSLRMETSALAGTRLTLELASAPAPALTASGPAGPQAAAQDHSIVTTASSADILLVDDDDFCRMVTESLFPRTGVSVRVAINGRLALEAVRACRPDIIILDIEMPVMGGVEALQHIRAYQAEAGQSPSLLVAATGHEDASSLAYFYQLGFDHCLTKPCNAADILALLRKLSPKPLVC